MPKITLPKPQKLKSGSWRIQFQIDGKRYSVTDEDKDVVKSKAEKRYLDIMHGIEIEKRTPLTVGKAIDKYIESKAKTLSPSTILGYKRSRKNSLQHIMDIHLSDLTQDDVQYAVGLDAAKGDSPKTIRNAHGLLSSTLKVYRPNFTLITTLPEKKKQEIVIFTEEEMKKVWKASEGTIYELPILIASMLGLRLSEIKGLRFSDISGDKIHVQRAMVIGEEGETLKTTKTASGDRWIKLPEVLIKKINALPKKSDEDYICPLTGASIYKGFQRICEKVGVKPCRFHDLRHFSASEVHSLGIPDKYAMHRMGHKTDNMLKTVYQHIMRDKEDQFSDQINERMEEMYNDR